MQWILGIKYSTQSTLFILQNSVITEVKAQTQPRTLNRDIMDTPEVAMSWKDIEVVLWMKDLPVKLK